MLEVVKYLKSGGSLQELRDKYAIHTVPHPKFRNLWLLKYGPFVSGKSPELVKECRGLILDEDKQWAPVAWPFKKFCNYGEPGADKIDWSTARVEEKLDGTMCVLWYYAGDWHVSTSGNPDASGNTGIQGDLNFRELFWQVYKEEQDPLPYDYFQDYTIIFELTTPHNRVVIPHQVSRLTLIGVRNRTDGREEGSPFGLEQLKLRGFPQYRRIKSFPLTTIKEIEETFKTLKPLEQEGYVVVDSAYQRIKVKSPKYLALHRLKGSTTPKRFLEVIQSGEASEFEAGFLVYFPEYTQGFLQVKDTFERLVKDLEESWQKLEKDIPRKQFAAEAWKTRLPGAMFSMLDSNSTSIREYLANMHIDKLLGLLK